MAYMEKFNKEHLKGVQEFVFKTFNSLPSRVRLPGMDQDLDSGQFRALVYFNAAITVLNNMGALKDGALDFVIPEIFQKTQETIWGDE